MVALLMKNKGRITVKITYVTSAFILVNNMHLNKQRLMFVGMELMTGIFTCKMEHMLHLVVVKVKVFHGFLRIYRWCALSGKQCFR
jgi:hypothetical protein